MTQIAEETDNYKNKLNNYLDRSNNLSNNFWEDYINYSHKHPYEICKCCDENNQGRLSADDEMQLRNFLTTDVFKLKHMEKMFDNFNAYKLIKTFLYCRWFTNTNLIAAVKVTTKEKENEQKKI